MSATLRILLWVAFVLGISATAIAQDKAHIAMLPGTSGAVVPATSASPANVNVATEYEIGAGDVLSINVWKEPDLSRALPVRPDGKLSLPLVGEIQASGMTAPQLQAKLTEQLRKFVEDPEVTVMVQEARSRRFNVVGEVQRPGSFVLTQPTTVLDAIALVGGFRDFAKVKDMYVLRVRPDGKTERLPFNYKKVIKGEQPQQNVELQPKDTVVVP